MPLCSLPTEILHAILELAGGTHPRRLLKACSLNSRLRAILLRIIYRTVLYERTLDSGDDIVGSALRQLQADGADHACTHRLLINGANPFADHSPPSVTLSSQEVYNLAIAFPNVAELGLRCVGWRTSTPRPPPLRTITSLHIELVESPHSPNILDELSVLLPRVIDLRMVLNNAALDPRGPEAFRRRFPSLRSLTLQYVGPRHRKLLEALLNSAKKTLQRLHIELDSTSFVDPEESFYWLSNAKVCERLSSLSFVLPDGIRTSPEPAAQAMKALHALLHAVGPVLLTLDLYVSPAELDALCTSGGVGDSAFPWHQLSSCLEVLRIRPRIALIAPRDGDASTTEVWTQHILLHTSLHSFVQLFAPALLVCDTNHRFIPQNHISPFEDDLGIFSEDV